MPLITELLGLKKMLLGEKVKSPPPPPFRCFPFHPIQQAPLSARTATLAHRLPPLWVSAVTSNISPFYLPGSFSKEIPVVTLTTAFFLSLEEHWKPASICQHHCVPVEQTEHFRSRNTHLPSCSWLRSLEELWIHP